MLNVILIEGDDHRLEAAQELRHRVFFPDTPKNGHMRRDRDAFDRHCRHLIVYDKAHARVAATCRLLDRAGAGTSGGFYTQQEFILPFVDADGGELLEIGRLCVDARYRQSRATRLLWRGLAECIERYRAKYIFGCVSLPGTDPSLWHGLLSRLWARRLAPPDMRPVARPDRAVKMAPTADNDVALPLQPLIKAYLRAGAYIGEGAVIDRQFSVIDICMIARTGKMIRRYIRKQRVL